MSAQTQVRNPTRRGRGSLPTLGDVVDAVTHFTADSSEAAVVIANLFAAGRIRLVSPVSGHEGPLPGFATPVDPILKTAVPAPAILNRNE